MRFGAQGKELWLNRRPQEMEVDFALREQGKNPCHSCWSCVLVLNLTKSSQVGRQEWDSLRIGKTSTFSPLKRIFWKEQHHQMSSFFNELIFRDGFLLSSPFALHGTFTAGCPFSVLSSTRCPVNCGLFPIPLTYRETIAAEYLFPPQFMYRNLTP